MYLWPAMKKLKILVLGVFLCGFTGPTKRVPKITFEQLEQICRQNNDTLYVVNYWATWCKPCVAEMPFFTESAKKFSAKKVKVVFVSLNAQKEMAKVEAFVTNKKIEQPVYLLNAGNPNVWIDKVDPTWGGSIPATIMYKQKEKVFFKEGEFTQTELDSIINLKLK